LERKSEISKASLANVILYSSLSTGDNWTNEKLLSLAGDVAVRPLNHDEWRVTNALRLIHTSEVICFEDNKGRRHRKDGPAFVTKRMRAWYNRGQWHRTHGPALQFIDGSCVWYVEGLKHRTDGPAVELANGHQERWIDGKIVDPNEF
jgi:hypothetical protein